MPLQPNRTLRKSLGQRTKNVLMMNCVASKARNIGFLPLSELLHSLELRDLDSEVPGGTVDEESEEEPTRASTINEESMFVESGQNKSIGWSTEHLDTDANVLQRRNRKAQELSYLKTEYTSTV